MSTQTLVIEKKKFRLVPEKEYIQLKDDLRDLNIILKRRNEKDMEARAFFAKVDKKKNSLCSAQLSDLF